MPGRLSFRIQKNRKLDKSINRIIDGQLEIATDFCRLPVAEAEYAVHEIRKTMKRLRAVLHLTRFAIGEERFNTENNRLREVTFLLTSLRKSAAHVSTFNSVAETGIFKGQTQAVNELKEYLFNKKKEEYDKLYMKQHALEICYQHLSEIKAMQPLIVAVNADDLKKEIFLKGMRRTYKTGCKRLHLALSDSSIDNNHNFRKSVKYLWYQMQLLKNLWPGVLGRYIIALDSIGERLGTEHDLAELEMEITNNKILNPTALEKIRSGIGLIRKKNQQQAWPIAMKVYAESPGAFTRRINAYWDAYFGY